MKSPVIKLVGVTKSFGETIAVDDVSISIKKGEVVGFVGVNGAGKTTTINLILGFTSPSGGSVILFGDTVAPHSASESHKRIGFASGDMQLPALLTGQQYLDFVMAQHPHSATRLKELVSIFAPQLHQKITTLSRGNKQKIALIAAFIHAPDLVILDEPTSGLDPIMQEAFLRLIHVEKARGTTVFMSSHYLEEVADVCSRIILMKQGKVVEDIDASTLASQGGKHVKVVTGYAGTRAPKGATDVSLSQNDVGEYRVAFTWKSEPRELQHWLAGVKQLRDIEISENSIEDVFRHLYETKNQDLRS